MSYSNPYRPSTPQKSPKRSTAQRRYPTADLGKRFLGSIVDGLAVIVFIGPGYALLIPSLIAGNQKPGVLFFAGMGVLVLGALGLFAAQVYLLVSRSQTIGKMLVKTKIMCIDTNQPADAVKTILLRSFVNGLIGGIPCVGGIYTLVDICYIFSEDHRCIHDRIAGTWVADVS